MLKPLRRCGAIQNRTGLTLTISTVVETVHWPSEENYPPIELKPGQTLFFIEGEAGRGLKVPDQGWEKIIIKF